MLRKNHTIGIRADELTVSLLADAATIFNISKSDIIDGGVFDSNSLLFRELIVSLNN